MPVAGKQMSKILAGLAGEYHVAAELCRRGFFASLTLKNYPKVDIFVMHPIEQHAVPVQVKTVARQGQLEFLRAQRRGNVPGPVRVRCRWRRPTSLRDVHPDAPGGRGARCTYPNSRTGESVGTSSQSGFAPRGSLGTTARWSS